MLSMLLPIVVAMMMSQIQVGAGTAPPFREYGKSLSQKETVITLASCSSSGPGRAQAAGHPVGARSGRGRPRDDLELCACREGRPCRSAGIDGYHSLFGMIAVVLVRFAYVAVSHAFAALWLLRMTDRGKDAEILALRHQLVVLSRQLGDQHPRLRPEDRVLLAALHVPLARAALRRFRLLVGPNTVLRRHRDLMKRRHARMSVNRGPGRSRTVASIHRLVLRPAAENPWWGYRRIHGELALFVL